MSADLRPGLKVVIVQGDARGRRGQLIEKAKVTFDGQDVWAIDCDCGGFRVVRSIQAGFLKPAEEES